MLTSASSRAVRGAWKSLARQAAASQLSQSSSLLSTGTLARSAFACRAAAFPTDTSSSSSSSSSSRRTFMSQGGAGAGEGNGKAAEGEKPAEEKKAAGAGEEKDEQTKLVEKLTAENKELKDKVLYTLAEMENVRTIARRDMESAKQFALQSFAKQLLDVADNLGRALDSVPKEAREGGKEGGLLATLVEGVEMTDTQLQKVLGANKIVKFGKPGDKFDPHLHDALFEYEEAGREGGSVGQVLKTGYTLNGRVIRPAQVGTVKKSS